MVGFPAIGDARGWPRLPLACFHQRQKDTPQGGTAALTRDFPRDQDRCVSNSGVATFPCPFSMRDKDVSASSHFAWKRPVERIRFA
jgi:hypothetical protein